tara:strand:- start:149 stop:2764 length:2616 start_codon:yes stop_codon:yes gene_type:complete
MKSKINKILYLFFFLLLSLNANTQEQFNFDVTQIDILENGNKFIGTKRGTITSNDGIVIEANKFEYNKKSNILNANGNIKIIDSINNYEIYSDKITYNKTNNFIFTNKNSKAFDLVNNIEISSVDFEYNITKNIITAKKNASIENKIENYKISSDEFSYLKNKNKIYSTGKTTANIFSKYKFISKDVTYLIDLKQLSSQKETIVKDKLNLYKLKKFSYLIDKEILKGQNLLINTSYNLPTSDKFYFKSAIINLKEQSFLGKDAVINIKKDIFDDLNNDPRIIGVSMSGNSEQTKINKGVFTSCKKNQNCTPWSIKASKITHDKKKSEISYDNAVLKIYDVPILYFPKFFHPDPTVKRKSGFLKPEFNSSNILGSSFTLPYFKMLSENKDFTIRPSWFDNNIFMSHSEYRQINKNSKLTADFGFVKNYKSTTTQRKKNLSHFFGQYDLDLGLNSFNSSDLSIFIQRVSNDNYLKIFEPHIVKSSVKPTSFDTLSNSIKIFLDSDNYYLESGLEVFQKLKNTKSDQYQYILPYYNFNRSIPWKTFNGNLNFSSSGTNDLNETNSLKTKIINNLNYNNSTLYNLGLKSNFNINLKNISSVGKKATNYTSSPKLELISLFNFNLNLPLIKEMDNYTNFLTPKILFKINPSDMNDSSSSTNRINVDNIFSENRLALSDTFETGRSVTVGIDFKKEKNVDQYFEFKLATSFRDKEENFISSKTTLNKKNSNLFGAINSQLSDKVKLGYNFSIDNNYNTLEYNDFNASFSLNNIVTGFSFIEENGELGDTNVLSNFFNYNINENNSLKFKTRRNRKINLTEYYDLVYEYKNDCLTAGIKYNKTYYSDGDIKPSENLFFSITLIPLTSAEYKANDILEQ